MHTEAPLRLLAKAGWGHREPGMAGLVQTEQGAEQCSGLEVGRGERRGSALAWAVRTGKLLHRVPITISRSVHGQRSTLSGLC